MNNKTIRQLKHRLRNFAEATTHPDRKWKISISKILDTFRKKDTTVDDVKLLMQRGADINEVSDDGYTALFDAARYCSPEVVKFLLDNGAEVNINVRIKSDKKTPLDSAVWHNSPEIVKLLIDAGADVNLGDPILDCIEYFSPKLEVLKILLDAGADIEVRDSENFTPLMRSLDSGSKLHEISKYLIEAGAKVNVLGGDNGYSPMVQVLESFDDGDEELLQLLLQHGADVNLASKDGWTPLMSAHTPSMIKTLLNAGADVNAVSNKGYTPLIVRALNCEKGDIENIKLLVEAGADVNAVSDKGSALEAAIANGRQDIAEYLIQHGANRKLGKDDLKDDEAKFKYLMDAIKRHDIDGMRAIIETGIDINDVGYHGYLSGKNTILAYAVDGRYFPEAEVLIDCGADPNIPDSSGRSPLTSAARWGELDRVIFLVKHGADVNADYGYALMSAVSFDQKDVVKYLISQGADVNITGCYGNNTSPLMRAASQGNLAMVKILVEAGADVMAKGSDGTAYEIAVKEGHTKVASYLKRLMPKKPRESRYGRRRSWRRY